MEAYLGTLAAANTVSSLDECSELKEIFLSTDPGHEVQKQSILELMTSTISWDPSNEIIRKALKANLESDDTNTRYLSLFLIKKTGDRSFIPLLTEKVKGDPDPVIRNTAVQCIDDILQGDVEYFLKALSDNPDESGQQEDTLELLLKLSWDRKNTLEAVSFFADNKWQKSDKLDLIAGKLYSVCPREIEDYIRTEDSDMPWLLALADTWLSNINPLNTDSNKKHWLTLLGKGITGLRELLVQKAIDNKSRWALEPLQKSLDSISDPAVIKLTKEAVKKLIEF
jgi:hypothetical protein